MDYQTMAKIAHFKCERVPERAIHAKAAGAHGLLTVTQELARYVRAALFAKAGSTNAM